MVRGKLKQIVVSQHGDTLIEVTIALAIVGMVLISSLAVASTAFQLGQTAQQRTQLSEDAQEQLEALRSFRDNHTWAEFRSGGPGYLGIDTAMTGGCVTTYSFPARCFSMKQAVVSGVNQWVPQAGPTTPTLPLNATIEISSHTANAARPCGYDFEVHYRFTQPGAGVPNSNRIETRLVNLKYALPPLGGPVCP